MKSQINKLLRYQKIRFGLVGIANTTVDFSVLLLLAGLLGFPSWLANVISTSCALVVSYILNKKAVFKDSRGGRKQVLLFVGVTLFGIWFIQTVILVSVEELLHSFYGIPERNIYLLLVAKIIGVSASLTWNFLWYSKVVFRSQKEND